MTCDETKRSECEKTEETLLTSWYPAVTAVFADKNITKGLKVKTWHELVHTCLCIVVKYVTIRIERLYSLEGWGLLMTVCRLLHNILNRIGEY